MKRFLLAVAAALAVALAGSTTAFADSGARSYDYLLGTSFLCGLAPSACPDIARAPNGDTVTLAGSGTFDIHAKSVTGGGTFIHKSAAGATLAGGTWTATELLAFHSYGTAAGLPSTFEGGQALIRVHLSVGLDGILSVNCAIGAPPPSGQPEGVRLDVPGVINFNKQVSGFTLFIRTA